MELAWTGRTARNAGGEGIVTSPSGTQAVDRAARLLTEVVHSPDAVTFTELAAATGLAKSTTSRLLLALERNGLVRRDDHGRFRPGEVFVRFAWRGGAEAGLTVVAQPFLDRLGELTGETINLGVEHDGLVEQIAQVDGSRRRRWQLPPDPPLAEAWVENLVGLYQRSRTPEPVRSLTVAARIGHRDFTALSEPRALASGPATRFFNNFLDCRASALILSGGSEWQPKI